MDVVAVMDGPETVVPSTDTSFGLVVAAAERGHRGWRADDRRIVLPDGKEPGS